MRATPKDCPSAWVSCVTDNQRTVLTVLRQGFIGVLDQFAPALNQCIVVASEPGIAHFITDGPQMAQLIGAFLRAASAHIRMDITNAV